jgi:hypothetical protein
VDPVSNGPSLAVCVLLDRVLPFYPRVGVARGDIKLEHKTDEFVGYQLVLSTSNLGAGPHELRTYALSSDGKWYESALAGFRLFRHHRAMPRNGALERSLRMSPEVPRDFEARLAIPLGTPIYANRWIVLRGWAIDEQLGIGAETIVATDESGRSWSGPANIEDPVARDASGATDWRLGFEVVFPAAVFGRGRHRVQLTGLDASGYRYANFVNVAFDVISALRPFPLVARIARSATPDAARLRVVEDARDVLETKLPTPTGIVLSAGGRVIVEGWALDETGAAADETFIELNAAWVDLPPSRHPALCARERTVGAMPAAPVDNAWFSATFDMPALPGAHYELALVVVQPGRRSYSRVRLASLLLR